MVKRRPGLRMRRARPRRRQLPVDHPRWFVLFRSDESNRPVFTVIDGRTSEQRDVAVVAFENGWHGVWVFDREPDQHQLTQSIINGDGIGKQPGAIQLYVHDVHIKEPS